MRWYPWLNIPYQQLLSPYQQGGGHHALLLHSQRGNGISALSYAISRWLMCRKPDGKKSCGACDSCRFMMLNNHPDFYQLNLEKGRQTFGVDSIRAIIDNAYSRSRLGGRKVILLSHIEQLTEQSTNILLKILEEPPKGTYCLLVCESSARLFPTVRSRCLYWSLPTPNKALGQCWLRQVGFDNSLSVCTALRLCANAPLAAENLLQPVRWKMRLALCTALQSSLTNGDFLAMLPILNRDDDEPLHWLLSLLTDILKWKYGAQKYIVNIDRAPLISSLALHWPSSVLHTQLEQWLICLRQFQDINGINRELLLAHYLLTLEQGITYINIPQ